MEVKNHPNSSPEAKRFVILWHALPPHSSHARSSHFDLMFEESDSLVTFEMLRIPIPSERVRLTRLADHRKAYLELEGALAPGSQGEDRGHVTRWASGSYYALKVTHEKRVLELNSDRFSAQIVLKPSREDGQTPFPPLINTVSQWPRVPFWEMYISRWAMKESPCLKI